MDVSFHTDGTYLNSFKSPAVTSYICACVSPWWTKPEHWCDSCFYRSSKDVSNGNILIWEVVFFLNLVSKLVQRFNLFIFDFSFKWSLNRMCLQMSWEEQRRSCRQQSFQINNAVMVVNNLCFYWSQANYVLMSLRAAVSVECF